ncbi:TetR/AcrR family transcriptional regulator [Dactylosporangium sp. NPDC051484]|uniref:TetR/AcrR family transcriptional regulator n=1 Tax=Dactylosporangium sp. NPDC051484 TaxID=3154942 RepID=UPI00344FDE44
MIRRRGNELQQAIFDAVFEQIGAIGYARLTMDRVAAAAGTSKPVLYRRWDSKEALVLDALRESLPSVPETPPGLGLREDLLAIFGGLCAAFVVTKGIAFHVVAAEAGQDCRRLADERVFGPAHRAILAVLRAAAERGEIRPDRATDLIADVGPALLRSRAIDGDVPNETMVAAVVDQVLMPLLHAPALDHTGTGAARPPASRRAG